LPKFSPGISKNGSRRFLKTIEKSITRAVKEFLPLKIAGTALGTLNSFMFLGIGFFQGVTGLILDHFMDSATVAYIFQKLLRKVNCPLINAPLKIIPIEKN
jgi:hypothetical protein